MHRLRLQSQGSSETKKSRDAFCPSQTHSWNGTAPIAGTMRRSRRVYPRCHRPKPPQTSQTQADGALRRITRQAGGGLPLQINPIAKARAPYTTTFSTESARSGPHPIQLAPAEFTRNGPIVAASTSLGKMKFSVGCASSISLEVPPHPDLFPAFIKGPNL